MYHKKGQKTSFDPYPVRFDPYPRPVVHQFLWKRAMYSRNGPQDTLWFKESATCTHMRQNEDRPDGVRDVKQG
ncbi:hypothetical protein KDA_48180 [Dictyobacter alpinus]|uniref:Uncharacterized protein n=1 Tax=Dictyobacter alpinus TaxID=2014873 RepID=A0A402BDB2_9CHLR|nr:hypothetical protein KDA_48180 [Dictyobacter alpinus]